MCKCVNVYLHNDLGFLMCKKGYKEGDIVICLGLLWCGVLAFVCGVFGWFLLVG